MPSATQTAVSLIVLYATTVLVSMPIQAQPSNMDCNVYCISVNYSKARAKARAETGRDKWRIGWVIELATNSALFIMLPDGSIYSHETKQIQKSKFPSTASDKRKSMDIVRKWAAVEEAAFYFNNQGILAFRNFPCEWDCSGHKEGYKWAENNRVTEYENCQGESQSFIEGCKIHVADQKLDVIPPK